MNVSLEKQFDGWEDLTYKQMNKALATGMKAAQKLVVKNAKSALASIFKNTNKKREGYTDSVASGIRPAKVNITDSGIFGDIKLHRKKDSGSSTYKLLFLNDGTKRRYTKTIKLKNKKYINYKRDAGSIIGGHFKEKGEQMSESGVQAIFNNADFPVPFSPVTI